MGSGKMPPVPTGPPLIESPKLTDIHGLVAEEQDAEQIAKKMLIGTYNEVGYKEYANLLGNKDMASVLKAFVAMLGPLPESLLASLQLLVSKIYFIAEAQSIDRILEELSRRWVECHPETFWEQHYKLCHIVLFSLLILNSDLHNDDGVGGQAKFSVQEFVENTVYALNKEAQGMGYTLEEVEPLIEEQLSSYYDSVKAKCLPLSARPADIPREESSSQLRGHVKGSAHSRQRFSMRSVTMTSLETSSSNGTSVYSTPSSQPVRKESNYSSNWKFHHNKPLPLLYCVENFDAEWNAKNDSLWLMDSIIRLCEKDLAQAKGNNESNDSLPVDDHRRRDPKNFFRWLTRSKPKSIFEDVKSPIAFLDGNAKWIKARVRIAEGRIFVFILKSSSSLKVDFNADVNLLKKQCSQYFVFNLFEAVANLVQENVVQGHLPDPFHLMKDHPLKGNFTVVIPAGPQGQKTTLEFQTQSVDEARKYVQCINFWAARITSVPSTQLEAVSSQEFGWGPDLLSSKLDQQALDEIVLSSWKPLLSIDALYDELQSISDQPDLSTRLDELTSFTQQLQNKIDVHNAKKCNMVELWSKSSQFEMAMDNWNKKYLYLNEINERSSKYLNALQTASNALGESSNIT